MNEDIKKMIDETINNHSLKKVNDKLYLKKYQIEVLDYYHIPYKSCSTISEILFFIDELLESEEDDFNDLEEVATSLQEFLYYNHTNK